MIKSCIHIDYQQNLGFLFCFLFINFIRIYLTILSKNKYIKQADHNSVPILFLEFEISGFQ